MAATVVLPVLHWPRFSGLIYRILRLYPHSAGEVDLRRFQKRIARLVVGGGLLFILGACGSGEPDAAAASAQNDAADRTLTIGIAQYPSNWHPNIANLVAKSYVMAMVSRPLTHYDHDWQNACTLCETLPTLENGLAVLEATPDGEPGMAVTFTLPKGLTWGDGTPVDTGDAKFTWEVGSHPMSGTNGREAYRSIYALDQIDDHTFTIHIDRRVFAYNQLPIFFLLPEHLERPIFEADPVEYRKRNTFDSDPTNPGLFNGPFLIDSVERGSQVTLKRNPYWYGKEPYFETIVVRFIERTTTLEANLLSGEIDMIAGELGLQVDQALAFEKRHGDDFNIIFKSGALYEHVDLRLDNPILADKRVRQALLYALDRESLVNELFGGRQTVAHSPIAVQDPVYFADLPQYAHDPQQAAKLLDAAGWMLDEGDDVRSNAAGEALRIELNTTAGDKTRELTAQVLQAQWRTVGIDVRIRNETPRVLFGQTLTERKFNGMVMFAWSMPPEPLPRGTMHSSRIPSPENNFSGQNYTGFADARVDELIQQLEDTLKFEERLPLWREYQKIYVEEAHVLPLMFRANPFILPKWLKGVRPTGHFTQSTLWIEDWYRETSAER
jgi:peptide/nickel transport system substrate-binding protein